MHSVESQTRIPNQATAYISIKSMIRNNVTIPGKIPSTGNLIPVCFVQTGI